MFGGRIILFVVGVAIESPTVLGEGKCSDAVVECAAENLAVFFFEVRRAEVIYVLIAGGEDGLPDGCVQGWLGIAGEQSEKQAIIIGERDDIGFGFSVSSVDG